MPTREIYWNIQGIWVMYLLFAVAMAVFAFGVYRQFRLISAGKPENRFDHPSARLRGVLLEALGQVRMLRDRYSGPMHLLFFSGFVVLFLGTVVVFLQADLGIPLMQGWFYLLFQSLILNVVGLLAVVGLVMAFVKRYALRPDRLVNPERHRALLNDGIVLGLLLAIVVTGFVVQGIRIAATADPWASWSPAGNALSLSFFIHLDQQSLRSVHSALWWFHLLLAFTFIAYVPYSKLRHLLLAPANIYFRSLQPAGALKPIEIESAETFGAAQFQDFTWKQLLDLRACIECGRCQASCPSYAAGQPLSPKALIMDLRRGSEAAFSGRGPRADDSHGEPDREDSLAPTVDAVGVDALWSCVTCGSCMRECPVFVEHVPAVIEMRRHLVMEKAEFPEPMQEALTSLEARGHPFRGTSASRTDWCEGLGVKIVSESGPAEWLYWVGCSAAFDDRNQKIARAFAKLLLTAGVDFAILGDEERCTGDIARRIGNEYLFQTMAQSNIETLNGYGVTRIVTTCPHCLNTLKNEYPQFGGRYEVYHHSQLLASLVREGRLRPHGSTIAEFSFHDPCYLARYNAISSEPREILQAIPGAKLVELERHGASSFCCGGGSGHLWYEESPDHRINNARADQILALDVDTVGVSCPFCMTMLTDGLKARGGEREVQLLDLAELLERATQP